MHKHTIEVVFDHEYVLKTDTGSSIKVYCDDVGHLLIEAEGLVRMHGAHNLTVLMEVE